MEVNSRNYQNFVDSNIDLASSIVLKCDDAARSLNQWVLGYTNIPVDETAPRTWKYYRNICGEYFPSDTVMYVTSLDSLEEIEFSKENLVFHRATKRAYAFGTTYYKELVDTYPDQELLIRGILYPVDMQFALSAYEGQILAYPSNLVEDTEPSLIPKLQAWINGFYRRWHNVQYTNTDSLYLTSMLAVLYAMMPGQIENIRKEACLTHEAHSYHVREYLASHSKLDKYMPYMTRSLAMYFYHNLAFIENNNGRQEIFDALIKRTFTDRNLPIGSFNLMHSTEHMPNESLTPLVVFEKTPMNTISNIDNKDQYSLSEILDIQDKLLPSNYPFRDEEQPKIVESATYTLNPNVPTKLLQSTVIDYADSEKYRFADIVLQHWLWLAKKDLYRAFVSFTIPATGVRVSLSPIDAFTFYAYAFCKGSGYNLPNLPTVVCKRVQRVPPATIASMREVCEKRYISDEWLRMAKATMPPPREMISLEAFRNHCNELFIAANEQYAFTALEEMMTTRAQKESATCRLWSDEKFSLGDYPDQNYADWFASRNLVVKDLNDTQLLEVASVILKEATGANLASTITLKDIQRAMRDIVIELSSYSIQIDLNINTGPVLQAGFTQIRPDAPEYKSSTHMYVTGPQAEPRNIKTYGYSRIVLDLNKYPSMQVVGTRRSHRIQYNLSPVSASLRRKDDNGNPIAAVTYSRRMDLNPSITCNVVLTAENPRNLTIVPGMEKFLELPLEQQLASYVDTWAK